MKVNEIGILKKTAVDHFRDWESSTFGFGYGSGEPHIIIALRRFFELCNEGDSGHSYDYEKLESALTPTVAWLLINILCKVDIIEYGTSPRFAWLTSKGERLKEFVLSHTSEELITIACGDDEGHTPCYPDACNCREEGCVKRKGAICQNPFWIDV